jgi:glycosyltransferase involved in cell wall biosynthesis
VSRSPRVLLVNYEYPPLGSGAGTATAALAGALANMGCDVVVLTSRFRGQPAVERTHGFTVRRVKVVRRRADRCSPPEMLTFIASAGRAALQLARAWRPDLTVAFFGIPGGPVAWLLRARFGVPYIVSLRGGDVPGFDYGPEAGPLQRASAPAIRFLWRRAAAVVANGSGLGELAEAALPGLRVPVVPNGVDVDVVPSTVNARPDAGDAVRLLFVGRLVHQKGCDVLLDALARIRHLPFTLDVVGDGPDREALQTQAKAAGIAGRVTFSGWVARERIGDHFRAAAAFALPSHIEGMPNALLEAMAHALPVVATDVPGSRDLVEHERTGLLVPAASADALARALERLIGDPALRVRLGAAARAHVAAHHTWAATAAAYLRLGGIDLPASAIADLSVRQAS